MEAEGTMVPEVDEALHPTTTQDSKQLVHSDRPVKVRHAPAGGKIKFTACLLSGVQVLGEVEGDKICGSGVVRRGANEDSFCENMNVQQGDHFDKANSEDVPQGAKVDGNIEIERVQRVEMVKSGAHVFSVSNQEWGILNLEFL